MHWRMSKLFGPKSDTAAQLINFVILYGIFCDERSMRVGTRNVAVLVPLFMSHIAAMVYKGTALVFAFVVEKVMRSSLPCGIVSYVNTDEENFRSLDFCALFAPSKYNADGSSLLGCLIKKGNRGVQNLVLKDHDNVFLCTNSCSSLVQSGGKLFCHPHAV